jgi:AraC family transcriptional regulator, positive regulator of tynA and feaB
LTQIEGVTSPQAPASLDLQAVEEAQRTAMWMRAARTFFPGLSVRDLRVTPSAGWMHGRQLGAGQLWTILSPPLHVHYIPRNTGAGDGQSLSLMDSFSVMVQMQGSTVAVQNERSCRLRPRDICLIDGLAPFELEVTDPFSHLMFVQIPRPMLLSRHPYLVRQTAETFDADEAGASLLRQVLLDLLDSTPALEDEQRAAALVSVAHLLGVLKLPSTHSRAASWRVRSALAFIDSRLSEPTLTANDVAKAQHISRRHLDEILLRSLGTSLTAQIWSRRLAQAASDLLDPRHAARTVTEIAFAAGFEDTAHFTRAFKRHHGCTPREWRNKPARALLRRGDWHGTADGPLLKQPTPSPTHEHVVVQGEEHHLRTTRRA